MIPNPAAIAHKFACSHEVCAEDVAPRIILHLQGLHGLLHALYWLHWTTHWQTNGDPFYGDHLMFQRLYEALPEEIDGLAEKMVQIGGRSSVAVDAHMSVMQAWLSKWLSEQDLVGRALGAERDLQAQFRAVYASLKEDGLLSLGLDDFLMGVSNTHETHLYLLQQRMGGILSQERHASEAPSSENFFFDSPRRREPRQFAESGALSNEPGVSKNLHYDNGPVQKAEKQHLRESPLTPTEVLQETPGSTEFSTLSRYVVLTETPTDLGVYQSHDEIPKHPDIK